MKGWVKWLENTVFALWVLLGVYMLYAFYYAS